jgi:hypothetical protein
MGAAFRYPYPLLGLVGLVVGAITVIDLLLRQQFLDFYGITVLISLNDSPMEPA